jgi:hypothetical protein
VELHEIVRREESRGSGHAPCKSTSVTKVLEANENFAG